jgi:hypothetical protein
MRRLVVFTVLTIVLAVPAGALALGDGAQPDGTVSVRNGQGVVFLNFNGAAVGRVGRGTIWIKDPVASDGDGADVWNCDSRRDSDTGTWTSCKGENIRFRAAGGKYTISLKGKGIFLSAVGRGVVSLDGSGDSPQVGPDGVFSLNDSPYRSLPDHAKEFPLVPPAGS